MEIVYIWQVSVQQIIRKLDSLRQTGAEMRRLALAFKEDMAPYATYTLPEIFAFLAGLPYRYDPDQVEFLQRPYYTVRGIGQGGDCDDKAIALASWAALHNLPFRFVAVGKTRGEPPHHVFTEVLMSSTWIAVDPTYGYNTLAAFRPYPVREIIG